MALLPPKKTEPKPTRRRLAENQPDKRPQAFSYRASRSTRDTNTGRELSREDSRPAPTKQRAWRLWLAVAALLVLAVGFSYQSTNPKIVVVGSSDSAVLLQNSAVYQGAVQHLLGGVFGHFKFGVNNGKLAANLQANYPELAHVQITEPLFSSQPRVTIQAYAPAIIMSGNGGTFVVDETGTARLASNQVNASLQAKLPFVTDQSGLLLASGKAVLTASEVSFITSVSHGLQAAKMAWQQLVLPPAASELDVQMAGKPYYVKFAMQGGADGRQQLGTFLAAINHLQGGAQPSQYVDVRVPERAYYK